MSAKREDDEVDEGLLYDEEEAKTKQMMTQEHHNNNVAGAQAGLDNTMNTSGISSTPSAHQQHTTTTISNNTATRIHAEMRKQEETVAGCAHSMTTTSNVASMPSGNKQDDRKPAPRSVAFYACLPKSRSSTPVHSYAIVEKPSRIIRLKFLRNLELSSRTSK